jgi:L-ascorbate metabolism protein UlaG (beta-lactamase superfamily)
MRFNNELDSSRAIHFLEIIKWQLFKKRTFTREKSALRIKRESHLLKSKEDFICWLGHASFLVQLNQKRFLFDPVFWNIPLYKRYLPTPYEVEMLGRVDYIFLSHVHYDHFDKASIKALISKNAMFIVPLGMERYLHKIDKNLKVETLDWYDSYDLEGEVSLTLVPAKHWGRREAFDTNRALWGGCILSSKEKSIYFAGDTAYDNHFKEIAKHYTIDYALLPIGAYEPAKIMKHNHLNPQEALEAFRDLKARVFVPMHYGTFRLSDEGINAPLVWWEALMQEEKGLVLEVGELKVID